jgi:hypothetical protein
LQRTRSVEVVRLLRHPLGVVWRAHLRLQRLMLLLLLLLLRL